MIAGKLAFNVAKLAHSSHSFFACVMPPINKIADFDMAICKVGDLKFKLEHREQAQEMQ